MNLLKNIFMNTLHFVSKIFNFSVLRFMNGKLNDFIFIKNKFLILDSTDSPAVRWNEISTELKREFLMDGKVDFADKMFETTNSVSYIYDKKLINKLIRKAKQNKYLYYGETDKFVYEFLNYYNIESKKIAIIGSTVPWYEAIVLSRGGIPYTIEYNKISSNDKRLNLFSFDEWSNINEKFDFIFSISSFEHDGLGRYGDPINPNGDLQAMRNIYKNLLSDSGVLLLSVPIGKDQLAFNAHRIYGKLRFPLLIKDFNIIKTFGFEKDQFLRFSESGDVSIVKDSRKPFQPIFVLSKSKI
jgi:hypothetical protein